LPEENIKVEKKNQLKIIKKGNLGGEGPEIVKQKTA